MKLFGYTIGAAVVASSSGANLYETAKANNLTTLVTAIDLAGLKDAVSSVSPLTVFAPTEAAFGAISPVLSYLVANSAYSNELLARVLKAHVLNLNVTAAQVPTTATQVPTLLAGQNVTVLRNTTSGKVTVGTEINQATVVLANVAASNGVAHVVDTVLVPRTLPLVNVVGTAQSVPTLSTLVQALAREGTQGGTLLSTANATLAGKALTVFAPTNTAFGSLLTNLGLASLADVPASLLAAVLKAHVIVDSDVLRAAGAKGLKRTLAGLIDLDVQLNVSQSDIETLNGVVHVVNQVIVPTLASYVSTQDDLSKLVDLIGQAGLLPVASGALGALTLFAPTDAAFAKLPAKVVNHLTNKIPFNEQQLLSVLKYHVLAGASNSTQLGASKATVQGETLSFGAGKINGLVNITAANLNDARLGGFVHKIDGVLVPSTVPLKTIAELAAGSGLKTLVAALTAANLTNTFDLPQTNEWTVFAPTDAAFAKIQSTVDKALANPELLMTILKAHVVPRAVFSKDLPAEITTLGGEKIKTSTLKVNTADVGAINGVVHLIDDVIIPPSLQAAPTVAPTTLAPSTKAPSKSDSAVLSAALTIAATFICALVF